MKRCWVCNNGASRVAIVDGKEFPMCPLCTLAFAFGKENPNVKTQSLEMSAEDWDIMYAERGLVREVL